MQTVSKENVIKTVLKEMKLCIQIIEEKMAEEKEIKGFANILKTQSETLIKNLNTD